MQMVMLTQMFVVSKMQKNAENCTLRAFCPSSLKVLAVPALNSAHGYIGRETTKTVVGEVYECHSRELDTDDLYLFNRLF